MRNQRRAKFRAEIYAKIWKFRWIYRAKLSSKQTEKSFHVTRPFLCLRNVLEHFTTCLKQADFVPALLGLFSCMSPRFMIQDPECSVFGENGFRQALDHYFWNSTGFLSKGWSSFHSSLEAMRHQKPFIWGCRRQGVTPTLTNYQPLPAQPQQSWISNPPRG